jgi:hypothetical protein
LKKQLLRQQLFATDAIAEMRAFELQLKKRPIKTDEEFVSITDSIMSKKYANAKRYCIDSCVWVKYAGHFKIASCLSFHYI